MPVVKLFYDEALDAAVRAGGDAIEAGLAEVLRTRLFADPAKCQIIMVPAARVTPMPVYVDIQFRANERRTQEVVAGAMQEVARILGDVLGAGLRIRAFDIDQSGLHALDVDGRAG